MKLALREKLSIGFILVAAIAFTLVPKRAAAAEKLVGLYSARVLSQSLPWIAQEAGLLKKYGLDFQLVYVASSGIATAAMLGSDAEIGLTGGAGIVRAFAQGATDLVFIASHKNVMTQSIVAKPEFKRPEELKGKKIGVTRIGSNTHYFTIQAMRRHGLDAGRDFTFIQTGGEPESLAALLSGSLDAATLTAPADAKAVAEGFRYLVYGPDLKIPYAATAFVTRRSFIAKRTQATGLYIQAMAEAAKILHTDREFVYKVLGKQLRLDDRKVLDAAYNAEIKALEPRLALKMESLQAILEEVAQVDSRAKKVKPQDLVDTRFLDEMEKSGFLNKIWPAKSQ